jgi:hypothetical protein
VSSILIRWRKYIDKEISLSLIKILEKR